MKKKSFISFFMLLLTLILSISGFSAWVLTKNTGDINLNDRMHTINVYYQKSEITNETIVLKDETVETDSNSYSGMYGSTAYDYYNKYQLNQIVSGPVETVTEENGIKTIVSVYTVCTDKSTSGRLLVTYKVTLKEYMNTKVYQYKSSLVTDSVVLAKTLSVKHNTYIKPFDVLTVYENCGFYTDESMTTSFDFSIPIISNRNIYIKYLNINDSLAKTISSTTGTLNIYDSSRNSEYGSGYNVNSAAGAFDSSSKIAYLAKSTINSESTINLIYGPGHVNIDNNLTGAIPYETNANHTNTADRHVSVRATNTANKPNKCDLKIKLTGDLTVYGNLVIGAAIGTAGGAEYSYIIGNYTELDLNGYNLIIKNGGSVTAFGLLSDSIGTGKVVIENGGSLIATFTVFDGRGGNQTTYGYAKGQAPFTHYCSPYLTANVDIMYGGSLIAYIKIHLGSLGTSNAYLNYISNDESTSLLTWGDKKTENDHVTITPYIVDELYQDTFSVSTATTIPDIDLINQDDYFKRFRIEINANLNINNGKFQGSIKIVVNLEELIGAGGTIEVGDTIDLYLSRTDLPISPVFDIVLKSGYKINIPYNIVFYPGSSLFTEKGSELYFNYIGNYTYAQKTVKKTVLAVINIEKSIPQETKYLSGGLISHTGNLSEYNTYTLMSQTGGIYGIKSLYFDTLNYSNIYIEGTINYNSSISSSESYKLSGEININNSELNKIKSSRKFKTYYMKSEQSNSIWFGTSTFLESGNDNAYIQISSYQISPLISYRKAYIYDSTNAIEGKYDISTNILTSISNDKYFLRPKNNHMLQGGSGKNYQDNSLDKEIVPTKINSVLGNNIVNCSEGNYVLYGGVFIPVSSYASDYTTCVAELNRFHSNIESSLYSTPLTNYSCNLKYDDTSAKWDYVSSIS